MGIVAFKLKIKLLVNVCIKNLPPSLHPFQFIPFFGICQCRFFAGIASPEHHTKRKPAGRITSASRLPIIFYQIGRIYLFTLNACMPGYTAASPSSSSIRSSWLYFATRSLLLGAPVLIWQVFRATARSAMVVSAVSPER